MLKSTNVRFRTKKNEEELLLSLFFFFFTFTSRCCWLEELVLHCFIFFMQKETDVYKQKLLLLTM